MHVAKQNIAIAIFFAASLISAPALAGGGFSAVGNEIPFTVLYGSTTDNNYNLPVLTLTTSATLPSPINPNARALFPGTIDVAGVATVDSLTLGGVPLNADSANTLNNLRDLSACSSGEVMTKTGPTTFGCTAAAATTTGSGTPPGTIAGFCLSHDGCGSGIYETEDVSSPAISIQNGVNQSCGCQQGWRLVFAGYDHVVACPAYAQYVCQKQ